MTNDDNAATAAASRRLILERQAARKKRYLGGVASIILTVLAGMVIGAGTTLLFMKNRMHRIPPRPEAIADAMINRLRDMVSLTAEEEKGVREIFNSHLAEIDAVRRESFRGIREMFRKMDSEVETVIGADRARIWREYKEQRYKRRGGDQLPPESKKHGH